MIRLLGPGDEPILERVAAGVFDDPVDWAAARRFLADQRHHLAVAIEDGVVVGMASAVHYEHPDKPRPELWINEVAVAPEWRGLGLGKAIVAALLAEGRRLGCSEAWVLTDRDNPAALRLYASAGGVEASLDQVMFSFTLD